MPIDINSMDPHARPFPKQGQVVPALTTQMDTEVLLLPPLWHTSQTYWNHSPLLREYVTRHPFPLLAEAQAKALWVEYESSPWYLTCPAVLQVPGPDWFRPVDYAAVGVGRRPVVGKPNPSAIANAVHSGLLWDGLLELLPKAPRLRKARKHMQVLTKDAQRGFDDTWPILEGDTPFDAALPARSPLNPWHRALNPAMRVAVNVPGGMVWATADGRVSMGQRQP